MQLISEKGFSPLCGSTLVVKNRWSVPTPAGINEWPCIDPQHRITKCCTNNLSIDIPQFANLQFQVNSTGLGGPNLGSIQFTADARPGLSSGAIPSTTCGWTSDWDNGTFNGGHTSGAMTWVPGSVSSVSFCGISTPIPFLYTIEIYVMSIDPVTYIGTGVLVYLSASYSTSVVFSPGVGAGIGYYNKVAYYSPTVELSCKKTTIPFSSTLSSTMSSGSPSYTGTLVVGPTWPSTITIYGS